MKHLRNRTSWAAIFALIAMVFTGCDSETDNITDAVVDSWDDIIGKLETCAEDRMKELADNPSLLCDGVEADYISLGDIFAVTIPMNNMGYAAVGLIFGNDAADFLSAVDSYGRNSKTKQDAKSAILKHFNSNWEDLFVGLIVLDGEFDFDYETDDLLDNSFDFDPKELYNILNERNAFSGCYGDDIPAGDTSAHNGGSKRTSSNSTGSTSHYNLTGYLEGSDGKDYPFNLEFDMNGRTISNAKYFNNNYNTTAELATAYITDDNELYFSGSVNNKSLIIRFSANPPARGTMNYGGTVADIRID